MLEITKGIFTDEEIILNRMKHEERSTYWLARQLSVSQSYVYRTLIGPGSSKKALTPYFIQEVKKIWPDIKLNDSLPEPLTSFEKNEQDRKDAENLFSNNK